MRREEYIKKIAEYIDKNHAAGKNIKEVKKDDLLFEKGIIDSFGAVQLVSHLESEFGVTIEPEELVRENLMTIEAIAGLLEKKSKK